jgi:hypothetical protein
MLKVSGPPDDHPGMDAAMPSWLHLGRDTYRAYAHCDHCGAHAELNWRPEALGILRPFLALHEHRTHSAA